ncbi:MAG: hypothetical protein AAF098_04695 [Pseudomonadota bacterium]
MSLSIPQKRAALVVFAALGLMIPRLMNNLHDAASDQRGSNSSTTDTRTGVSE